MPGSGPQSRTHSSGVSRTQRASLSLHSAVESGARAVNPSAHASSQDPLPALLQVTAGTTAVAGRSARGQGPAATNGTRPQHSASATTTAVAAACTRRGMACDESSAQLLYLGGLDCGLMLPPSRWCCHHRGDGGGRNAYCMCVGCKCSDCWTNGTIPYQRDRVVIRCQWLLLKDGWPSARSDDATSRHIVAIRTKGVMLPCPNPQLQLGGPSGITNDVTFIVMIYLMILIICTLPHYYFTSPVAREYLLPCCSLYNPRRSKQEARQHCLHASSC